MTLRRHLQDDISRDIREHIEFETRDNIERGMSPQEARLAALRKFGNVLKIEEDTRAVWSGLGRITSLGGQNRDRAMV